MRFADQAAPVQGTEAEAAEGAQSGQASAGNQHPVASAQLQGGAPCVPAAGRARAVHLCRAPRCCQGGEVWCVGGCVACLCVGAKPAAPHVFALPIVQQALMVRQRDKALGAAARLEESVLDLTPDETRAFLASKRIMRWDKRKKKYVKVSDQRRGVSACKPGRAAGAPAHPACSSRVPEHSR